MGLARVEWYKCIFIFVDAGTIIIDPDLESFRVGLPAD
jgi:hypothetical protein